MHRLSLTPKLLVVTGAAALVIVVALLGSAVTVPKSRGQTSITTSAETTTASYPKTYYVQISCGPVSVCTNGFHPRNLTIPAGSRVTWSSGEPPELYIYHRIIFQVGGIASGQLNGDDEFSANFPSPGVYQYYDDDFPGNAGTITVVPTG